MKKILVVGLGNVGTAAARAIQNAPDLELCGIVRRGAAPAEAFPGVPVVRDAADLPEPPDAAVLCLPSELSPGYAARLLSLGIPTADSFDLHERIPEVKEALGRVARENSVAALTAAGWDPGLDSVVRALMEAAYPGGETVTDFGPGTSMGHSVAARACPGVKDALCFTLPLGQGQHRRVLYVVPQEGCSPGTIKEAILKNPYFEHGELDILFDGDLRRFRRRDHRVKITHTETLASGSVQTLTYRMSIENPALTGNMLCCASRAVLRLSPGCYTLDEVPPRFLLPEGAAPRI
ncbi:MAG TPA: diaminopimelate dehydrogenase [Oscillospiraceae bacterium]|nr:diaminopimelate dehydrogenase [Oscillospiraceae bacterium]HNW04618.1 diaminopimelate dehydrogenase [Oscillospiraceae bacterium]